jgi:branched-chain amino acid transport system ATP-binding protein
MLNLKDVHTYYGKSHILHGVSFVVKENSVTSLAGRNGVGKTTTLRSIMGFTHPKQGIIEFDGIAITDLQPHAITRMGISLVPQGRRIFTSLSVKENLDLAAYKTGKSLKKWNQDNIFSLFPLLRQRLQLRSKTLSGGEMQMLAIARGLMANPRLLLMDEPTEGLAPLLIREIKRVILKIKEEARTSILLVEQNFQIISDVADYVYVMSKGEVIYESRPCDLTDGEVKAKYLGIAK